MLRNAEFPTIKTLQKANYLALHVEFVAKIVTISENRVDAVLPHRLSPICLFGISMKLKCTLAALVAFAGVFSSGIRAEAVTSLVTNGDFEGGFSGWTYGGGLIAISSYYQQTSTSDWPQMWPGNGLTNSPNGGKFVISDGGEGYRSPISQTISGLEVGSQYELSFQYAGSQEQAYNGATQQHWEVDFGTNSFSTPVMNVPNHGFQGWFTETRTFTATSTSQLLKFLAIGTPAQPPWSLLDGVTLTKLTPPGPPFSPASIPEDVPGPLPMVGLGCAAAWSRRLRRRIQVSRHGVAG